MPPAPTIKRKRGIRIRAVYLELTTLLLLALISDLRTSKIRNKIVYPFILLGGVTNYLQDGYPGLASSFRGVALPLTLLFVLFMLRILGAGDIKLFCAVGAVMGPDFVLDTIVYSFLVGGVLAAGILLARRNGREGFKHLFSYLRHSLLTRSVQAYTDFGERVDNGKFPFAPAVACGALLKTLADYLLNY